MKIDCYLLGVLFGDGTLYHNKRNRTYQVWIDQHKRNWKVTNEVKRRFRNLGFNVFNFSYLDKIRVAINSKEFFSLFSEVRKEPVKFFKNLKNKERFLFIGGFFDAEGTCTDRIVIYNKEIELLKEIQKFLIKKKIICYIYKFPKVYGLQIYRRQSIKIFLKLIKAQRLFYPLR